MWRTLTVLLIGLTVLQIRADDATATATPTTTTNVTTSTAAAPATSKEETTPKTITSPATNPQGSASSSSSSGGTPGSSTLHTAGTSFSTAAAASTSAPPNTTTTAATTEPTTTPLQLATLDTSNNITAIDGKLLLQKSVALSNQVQSLIDEINALEASVNATNSPYFDQMTQMQANATLMNATLSALIMELDVQNGRLEKLNVTVANFTNIYNCFAASQCVTPVPITTTAPSTTTPPLSPCPTNRAEHVTNEHKEYDVRNISNVQCSDVFTADDGFNVVLEGNVTILGKTAALNIYNGRTGLIISRYIGTYQRDGRVQCTHFLYFSGDPCADPLLCNGGTCAVDPNTGGALCICAACKTGDYCQTDTYPCDTSAARRKCRVDQSDAPGTCSVDDSITEYCAYKCNCTYPVPGVPNQCGTSPSQLQYATWWEPSQTMSLSPLYKIWKNLW